MGNRESFIFYRSFFDAISDLKDKDRLQLYDAICTLYFEEKEIELKGIPKKLFTLMRPQILANQKKLVDGKKGRKTKKRNQWFSK